MKKLLLIISAMAMFSLVAFAQKSKKIKISKMDQEFLSKQADGMYAKF